MERLPENARIFTHIPGTGYVGVGTVVDQAVPVRDFMIEHDGVKVPILSLASELEAPMMDENADDADRSEYVVRVNWLRTVPVEHAIWENGMFANQNVVAKLRNRFTLERLSERFSLEDEPD